MTEGRLEAGHPTTSVVVPVRNAADLLGVQLEALGRQRDCPTFEVIVSDNGSTDSTVEVAWALAGAFDSFTVVDSSGSRGVAHARNAGARASRGEFVLFCDADDEVGHRWTGAMSRALQVHDLVGGRNEYSKLNSDRAMGRSVQAAVTGLPTTFGYLPYAVGCNLGVRRRVFDALGGFDRSYLGGHEEVDFAWRAQEAGYTLGFAAEAVVHYRLRPELSGAIRQFYGYGFSSEQLRARFAHSVGPAPTGRDEVRTILRLAGSAHRILSARRGHLILDIAYHSGRWSRLVRARGVSP